MQIGFNLPVSGPMATAEVMANIAQLGESLGFDYLTLTDHVALPDTSTPGYPYSTTGEFYTPDPGHRVEQLTTAAWVAVRHFRTGMREPSTGSLLQTRSAWVSAIASRHQCLAASMRCDPPLARLP